MCLLSGRHTSKRASFRFDGIFCFALVYDDVSHCVPRERRTRTVMKGNNRSKNKNMILFYEWILILQTVLLFSIAQN